MDFKKSFCWRSNLSNYIIISAYTRIEFWFETVLSRFIEPGCTSPTRIPRNTSHGYCTNVRDHVRD